MFFSADVYDCTTRSVWVGCNLPLAFRQRACLGAGRRLGNTGSTAWASASTSAKGSSVPSHSSASNESAQPRWAATATIWSICGRWPAGLPFSSRRARRVPSRPPSVGAQLPRRPCGRQPQGLTRKACTAVRRPIPGTPPTAYGRRPPAAVRQQQANVHVTHRNIASDSSPCLTTDSRGGPFQGLVFLYKDLFEFRRPKAVGCKAGYSHIHESVRSLKSVNFEKPAPYNIHLFFRVHKVHQFPWRVCQQRPAAPQSIGNHVWGSE